MFKFEDLKQIHLEITTRCQASCPMCSRNYHGGLKNPNIKLSDWSFEDFKQIFSHKVATQIKGVYFCGNFGDPIINKDLDLMCSYLTDLNSSISLRIHTNGSARTKEWWANLPKCLPEDHVVVFGIDGLKDTHSLYRIGTDFEQIIENAKTFIQAGGIAEWVFIKFKHNEHQIEQAKQLAKEVGFQRFSVKNSSRFLTENKFSVLNSFGNTDYYLEPSSDSNISFVTEDVAKNVDKWLDTVSIDCYVLKNKEIYIDAHKILWPCCFLAATPYNYVNKDSIIYNLKIRARKEHDQLVEDLGGIDKLDLTKNNIETVLESELWQTVWNHKWSNRNLLVCARTCGKSSVQNFSKPSEQIIERVSLDDK